MIANYQQNLILCMHFHKTFRLREFPASVSPSRAQNHRRAPMAPRVQQVEPYQPYQMKLSRGNMQMNYTTLCKWDTSDLIHASPNSINAIVNLIDLGKCCHKCFCFYALALPFCYDNRTEVNRELIGSFIQAYHNQFVKYEMLLKGDLMQTCY